MTRKSTLTLLFFLVLAHGLAASKVYVGPKLFRPHDGISIKQVVTSSTDFKPGDTVIVRGTYSLNSRPAAKIGLYVTRRDRKASRRNPDQMKLVTSGRGYFELKIVIPAEGYLHLSFYPGDQGKPFGGVYFGSKRQMQQIKHWSLRYYLEG